MLEAAAAYCRLLIENKSSTPMSLSTESELLTESFISGDKRLVVPFTLTVLKMFLERAPSHLSDGQDNTRSNALLHLSDTALRRILNLFL